MAISLLGHFSSGPSLAGPSLTALRVLADDGGMEQTLITSRQNQRVKDAVLLRQSRHRRQQRLFLVDGVREISRALAAGIECQAAFICEELLSTPEAIDIAEQFSTSSAERIDVNRTVFEKLAFGDREDGIVLVAKTPRRELSQLVLPDNPLIVVIEGVEKPGNVGAILRTADGAGVDAVIVADGPTDLFNPNTIRASLGTVFGKHICEATASETQAWLSQQGIQLLATRPDAEQSLFKVNLRGPTALVLGCEATGLSEHWNGEAITPVRLPMHGIADSLNVSATAAVLCYEALRQRIAPK